jgi:hypothetical protein
MPVQITNGNDLFESPLFEWLHSSARLIEKASPLQAIALDHLQVISPHPPGADCRLALVNASPAKASILFLPYPSLGCHGLYLKMQRPGERMAPAQLGLAHACQKLGYSWRSFLTVEEAIREIVSYMCMKKFAEYRARESST